MKRVFLAALAALSGCPAPGGASDPILTLQGDFDRGRDLVFESPMTCRACHRFGTGDEKMGPDLGTIGAKYDRRKLLDTILDPSREIDPKYSGYLVETAGGAIHNGILVERTAARIVLRDAEKTVEIAAKDVKRMAAMEKSIMPDSLLKDFTPQDVADLLEFLSRLK